MLVGGICASVVAGAPEVAAQVVGPNVNISDSAIADHSPSIAVMGNNLVVAWWLGTALSRDGGFTWTKANLQPGVNVFRRPSVCIDSHGTAFCAIGGTDGNGYSVFVFSGSFNDPTWQWRGRPNAGPAMPFTYLDGVQILCDRRSDLLYVVYTRRPDDYQGQIQFLRSTDSGASWSPPEMLSGDQCNTAQLALGPDGELYVAWEDYEQGAIVGRKSTDQGLSFGAPFTLGAIRDNVSFGPPGWQDQSRSAMLENVACMDVPSFLGLAVDTSAGPGRGTIYGVWTEYAAGSVNPDPVRTVVEREPNAGFVNATPIQIGDDFSGMMVGTEDDSDCDRFTFEGTAGTTIQITGSVTACSEQSGCRSAPFGFELQCGGDSTEVALIGCGSVYGASPIPPATFTLPTTGRYYLDLGCGLVVGTTAYEFKLREYVVGPGQGSRDHRDVVLVRSTDSGTTWSEKVRVNDYEPMYDNAIPAASVDGSGRVHVAWYDRREEPECGARVHTFWTWSEDGGVTFQPSQRVSEQPSEGGRPNWRVGDQLKLHTEGEKAYLLWTHIPTGGGDGEIYGSVIGFGGSGTPEILEVEPGAGPPGTPVEIRGRNLADVTVVLFRHQSAPFTVVSDSLISTQVPADAHTGYVAAANPPRRGLSPEFFYVTPRIGSVLPSKSLPGQSVKIVGVNFTGASQVRFNGTPATFTVVSDTLITAAVPEAATAGPIEVTGPGGTAASDPFLIGALISGVNLAWNDCGANGASLKQFACNTNTGPTFTLVGSFTPPVGVDRFSGITSDLRIINPFGLLPDWWKVSTGGCRRDALGSSYDFTSGPSSCRDFYRGELSKSLSYDAAYAGPSHARLLISATIPADRVGPLDAAFEYYGFKIHVQRVQTVGLGRCAGCDATVRIELRSIQLHQTPEANDDPVITAPLISQVAYWQSAAPDIESFLPRQAPAGARVGIRGRGFTGTTSVVFNGSSAAFDVTTDSLVLATVPDGAVSGPITVTNPFGSDTSDEPLTIGPRLGGINLSWTDCGAYGDALQRFACDVNTGPVFDLVASFRPPPDVTWGIGISVVFTIANPDGALPDWWRHGAGGCRVAFSSSFNFIASPGSCADFLQGQVVSGLTYVPVAGDPSRARVIVQGAIPPQVSGPLDPDVEYYAAILRVLRSNTVGTGACAGCDRPMCIGLESVQLFQPPELGYDPVIDVPDDNTVVAWQNADPACLAITPVQVALVTAEAYPDHIRIVWELPGGQGATVDRREGQGEWRRLAQLLPDGSHRIEYVDRDVRPGATYGYRLQLEGEAEYVGETSVTVPSQAWTLALGRLRWSRGSLQGTITLPEAGPATLEIFDLGGRRANIQRFDGLDAGEHRVELRAALRPGVYFGRLTQWRAAITRRFVVVE